MYIGIGILAHECVKLTLSPADEDDEQQMSTPM
jgi:hypothetical protein